MVPRLMEIGTYIAPVDLPEDHPFRAEHERTKTLAPRFLGLTKAQAVRLASELGLELMVTDDATEAVGASFSYRRVAVHVRDELVISADAY